MTEALQLQSTGGDETGYLFKHLILTEEEYTSFTSDQIKELAKQQNIDFISVQMKGSIDYYHTAEGWKEDFINENGIISTNDWVHDLGKGIYVVQQTDGEAVYNLKTYVGEGYDMDDRIIVIEGSYRGPYLKCVFGDQHRGYIVLQTEKINAEDINDIHKMSIEEFLLEF